MNVADFIKARMTEGKRAAERIMDEEVRNQMLLAFDHILLVVDWHQNWPMLMESEPKLEVKRPTSDVNQFVMSMTKQVEWVTQKAYVERFGKQPPTAPLLLQIAQSYSWHPDYDTEWDI